MALALAWPSIPVQACVSRIGQVTVLPSTTGAQACYDINFDLTCELASGMALSIMFPVETNLYYVTGDNIEFEGRDDRLDVLAQSVVFRLTSVLKTGRHRIKICGVQNPPRVGPHVIGIFINGQLYNSPEFTFNQTGVTIATVTPKPDVVKECAEYTIEFNVVSESGFGCTCSRSTSFYLEFPVEVQINASIDPMFITINGISANRISIERNKIVVSSSMHFLPGMKVVIKIDLKAGLKNPDKPGWYRMNVNTSVDRIPTPSKPFYIRPSTISRPTVNSDNPYTCSLSTIVVKFSTGIQGDIPKTGYVKVTFPKSFYVPAEIAPGNIAINNRQVGSKLVSSRDNIDESMSFAIPVMEEIRPESEVVIVILPNSGIRLPSTYGNHSIDISTSVETSKVPSLLFAVTQSQVGSVSYVSNPAFVTLPATHTITFRTGGCGDLTPSVDTISIQFPKEMWMPNSFICQGITINNQVLDKIPYIAGSTLQIAPPKPISGDTTVTITIPESCGIRNPTKAGAGYKVKLWTTKEPAPVISNVVAFASTRLSGVKMEMSRYLVGSRVKAKIQFITGDAGFLRQSSRINIAFPEGFKFIGSVSMMNFSVNGTTSKSVGHSEQNVTIGCPKEIGPNSVIDVEIDIDAGLMTPLLPGYFKVGVSTDSEPETILSDDVPVNTAPVIRIEKPQPNSKGWLTKYPLISIITNSALDEKPLARLILDNEPIEAVDSKIVVKDGFHVLEAEAIDRFGNKSEKIIESFSVDAISPTFDTDPGTLFTNGKSFFKMIRAVDENNISLTFFGDQGISFTESVAGYVTINVVSNTESCYKGTITATDEAGNTSEFKFEVCFDWTKPNLDFPDRVEASDPVYILKGTTEPDTVLIIKDNPYQTQNGNYEIRLRLSHGLNFISITAKDKAGNIDKKNISIMANLEQSLIIEANKNEVIVNRDKRNLKIAPFIQNGTLYAPFDILIQTCVFKLESWPYSEYRLTTEAGKSVFIHPSKSIEMAADNQACVVDGEIVKMPVKPMIKSGILFVPVRFTVGLFGLVPQAEGKKIKISYIKN